MNALDSLFPAWWVLGAALVVKFLTDLLKQAGDVSKLLPRAIAIVVGQMLVWGGADVLGADIRGVVRVFLGLILAALASEVVHPVAGAIRGLRDMAAYRASKDRAMEQLFDAMQDIIDGYDDYSDDDEDGLGGDESATGDLPPD